MIPLIVACLVLVNALTWRRPRPLDTAPHRSVQVLVPARNEEQRLGAPIRAASAQAPVLLLDDGSTDRTAERAREAGATVLTGEPLPPGWVGKPWAVEQLGRRAEADVLLFLDADVVLEPGAVAAIVSELDTCDVLTAVPRQATGSFAEELVLPLLHLTYAAWLPLALVERVSDPRVLAANGQILAVRREAWARMDGFHSARNAVVDDMVFCAAAKSAGLRVRFVDGHHLGTTRMYEDFGTVVGGFSKNIYEGLGGPVALWMALLLYVAAFVAPYGVVVAGLAAGSDAWVPGAVGVGANLAVRSWLAVRHGHTWRSVVLHPVGVLVLCGIALNSWRWSRRHAIVWSGRVYRTRESGHPS
ncbi:MAG: glycosyltransferase [Myxococcota bacterium]